MTTATPENRNSNKVTPVPSIDMMRTSLYTNADDIRKLFIDKINQKLDLVQQILKSEDPKIRQSYLRSLPSHQMVMDEIMDKVIELDQLIIRLEKAEKISQESV